MFTSENFSTEWQFSTFSTKRATCSFRSNVSCEHFDQIYNLKFSTSWPNHLPLECIICTIRPNTTCEETSTKHPTIRYFDRVTISVILSTRSTCIFRPSLSPEHFDQNQMNILKIFDRKCNSKNVLSSVILMTKLPSWPSAPFDRMARKETSTKHPNILYFDRVTISEIFVYAIYLHISAKHIIWTFWKILTENPILKMFHWVSTIEISSLMTNRYLVYWNVDQCTTKQLLSHYVWVSRATLKNIPIHSTRKREIKCRDCSKFMVQ